MAWFPWVAMPVRVQSDSELIDWLRYRAIDFGAPSAFVDSIDRLHGLVGADKETDELRKKLETQRDALKDALTSLVKDPADRKRLDVAREVLDELK